MSSSQYGAGSQYIIKTIQEHSPDCVCDAIMKELDFLKVFLRMYHVDAIKVAYTGYIQRAK